MADELPVVIRHDYSDAQALTEALAAILREAAVEAMQARGQAVFALAGGRTPLPAYRQLADELRDVFSRHSREGGNPAPLSLHESASPWIPAFAGMTSKSGMSLDDEPAPRLLLLPTDERCVPHDHPACNARELRGIFASLADTVIEPLTTPDGDPDASARAAQAMLARHPQPFDLVVLGMGADAHTASLFPGASQLPDALDRAGTLAACRIDPQPLPPEAPFARVTLTLPRLLHARALHLVVTGEAKRAVLDAALSPDADPMRMPVAALLHAPGAHVHVHWSP